MDQAELRRTRLSQLLDLAQNYKGWTRKELAKALRRDPTKLVPGSGVPKLDLVVDLSRVLDWGIDDVVNYLWVETEQHEDEPDAGEYEALDAAAREAHSRGAYSEMIDLARQAAATATTPEERARAANREAGGWDGLGRYSEVLKAIQGGLAQHPVAPDFRRMLQSNLAVAYYSMWSLVESKAISAELLSAYRACPPAALRDRKTQAFAHYVAGHTARRLMAVEEDRQIEHGRNARIDLEESARLYRMLSEEFDEPAYAGIANTCQGGLIEISAALGECEPVDAIAELTDGLDRLNEAMEPIEGDWLESYGWWCIFGCNVVLRHIADEKELQRHMAVFTLKADDIAEQTDNWAMRERVFTMDHSRWERAVGCSGFEIPRVVDDEDVRVITGTMARFPNFRETGWRILHSARIVRSN